MPYKSFEDAVDAVMQRHPEYAPDAYAFMRAALDETSRKVVTPDRTPHLSAEELYLGFCAYALEEFGPMAAAVMEHWGISTSSDVGAIVYNLIEVGVFGKQSGDTREQFNGLAPLTALLNAPYETETKKKRRK